MTTWLIELPCPNGPVQALYWYKSPNGYGWTTLACDALRYESQEAAEGYMATWALKDPVFVAEHLFMDPQ